jgi:hypothetical protein
LPAPAHGVRGYGDGFNEPDLSSQMSSSSQPLMIELQNGRYVRVNSTAIDGQALPLNASSNGPTSFAPAGDQSREGPVLPADPSPDLAPVVLIFRDGRSEEVRDYTISNGTLYARGDFYTDGYWNKKIDLSGLSVSETLQTNASRGVKFLLPSSPNEVVTRP